jgi:hypothetical protein
MAGSSVTFVPDELAITNLRFGWDGPIGRDLNRRLRTLEFRARMSAGISTGQLRAKMETKRSVERKGLRGDVGSPVKYAAAHHEGAKPHVIRPRSKKYLRFVVGGTVVFATRVHHPGNRPNPYLTRWLREAVK